MTTCTVGMSKPLEAEVEVSTFHKGKPRLGLIQGHLVNEAGAAQHLPKVILLLWSLYEALLNQHAWEGLPWATYLEATSVAIRIR